MSARTGLLLWGLAATVLALLGIFIGQGLLLGVIVCVPLIFLSAALINRLDRDGEARLLGIFLLAVAIRWSLSAFIHFAIYNTRPGLFSPDEISYFDFGHALSEGMLGRAALDAYPMGVAWIVAGFEYVFGYGPMIPKLVNCIFGAWAAVLAGLIAGRFYPPKVVGRTALLATFTPSLALWSALMIKDNWTLFGVELALLSFLHLRSRFRLWLLLVLAVSLVGVSVVRAYEVLFVGLAIAGGLVAGFRRRTFGSLVLFGLLAVIVVTIVAQSDAMSLLQGDQSALERINMLRNAYTDAGSAIDISVVDTSTVFGMALWVPLGLAYFFFAPVPFTGSSAISLATSPEMIIWYALIPTLWGGLRSARRANQLREMTPVLLYCLGSAIGWSMAITNAGSLFRYRSQVMFVPLMLIAARQIEKRALARERAAVPAIPGLTPDRRP